MNEIQLICMKQSVIFIHSHDYYSDSGVIHFSPVSFLKIYEALT